MPTSYYNHEPVLAAMLDHFGVTVSLNNTGGGCMVYEGRLEAGLFIAIIEAEDFISPWSVRSANEAENRAHGWAIGLYLPDPQDPTNRDERPIAAAIDRICHFADLPHVVKTALAAVRRASPASPVFMLTDAHGTRQADNIW